MTRVLSRSVSLWNAAPNECFGRAKTIEYACLLTIF